MNADIPAGDEITLAIELAGRKWITSNQRLHHMARARETSNWRDIAAWRARRLVTEPIPYARVVIELRFASKHRRDPANWAPTAKAVVDGLVDSGVFPDDDHTHVIGPDLRIGPVVPLASQGLVVHIYPLERP